MREFESSKAGERRVYLLLITCHLLPDSLFTLPLTADNRACGAGSKVQGFKRGWRRWFISAQPETFMSFHARPP